MTVDIVDESDTEYSGTASVRCLYYFAALGALLFGLKYPISKEDLSFFDAARHEWVAEPGEFHALIGVSSADIRADIPFTL